MESSLRYPKITLSKENKYYITIYIDGRRYRLYNGSSLGINIYPNSFLGSAKYNAANVLAAEAFKAIQIGRRPSSSNYKPKQTDIESLKAGLDYKLAQPFSDHHKTMLKYAFRALVKRTNGSDINIEQVQETLNHFTKGTSFNMMRRYLSSLINSSKQFGLELDLSPIKKKKTNAKLHKPIVEIERLLDEIKEYNQNLYLCCLLIYGCLLRPHREIRELKWSDFSNDLSTIRLAGVRNKSGRNRIVPVPYYVKEVLKKSEDSLNIFSGKEEPFAPHYFKGLWSRFKKRSKLLERDQTLYSFRHTGAIDVYKRTGSIEKLKAAMGHSNVIVSLTYLRGLDVAELQEADMPMI